MTAEPRRHWFRFSLRTLLIVITLASCSMAWVAYQLNWIRQRRAERAAEHKDFLDFGRGQISKEGQAAAPWQLAIFGEQGLTEIVLWRENDLRKAELQSLFPEAHVTSFLHPNDYKSTPAE